MSITDVGGASGQSRSSDDLEKSSPKEIAGAALQAVKSEIASFAATAQEKASEKVSEKTEVATQTLGDFASAIRKAGDDLAQNDQSLAGKVVKQAADGLESFSRSITDKRPEDLLNAVRDFGRNNPVAFIAGSVLLGIAVGRLAKSTERRSSDDQGMPGYRLPTDYLSADDTSAAPPSASTYGSGT